MKPTVRKLGGIFLAVAVVFSLLAVYLNLNLASINYGYQLQRLSSERDGLKEEIDQLLAKRAALLNLQRVETVVTQQLSYQYPQGDQYIKVLTE